MAAEDLGCRGDAAGVHQAEPAEHQHDGEMFTGGLGAGRLPEDDDVDHDAEAVELVFLPGLVVLAGAWPAPA
jgi:hypothetical protein